MELPARTEIGNELIIPKTIITSAMEFSHDTKLLADLILRGHAVKPLIGTPLIQIKAALRINGQRPEFVSQFERHKQGPARLRKPPVNGGGSMIEFKLRVCGNIKPRFLLVQEPPFDTDQ